MHLSFLFHTDLLIQILIFHKQILCFLSSFLYLLMFLSLLLILFLNHLIEIHLIYPIVYSFLFFLLASFFLFLYHQVFLIPFFIKLISNNALSSIKLILKVLHGSQCNNFLISSYRIFIRIDIFLLYMIYKIVIKKILIKLVI